MKKYLFGLWLVLVPFAVFYLIVLFPFGGNGVSRSLQDKTKLQYPMPEEQKATLRRGLQVYQEVCLRCHGLNRIKFDDLHGDTGFITLAEAGELASEYDIRVIRDNGEECHVMVEKQGSLSDYFPSPYSCDGEAKAANNDAMPYDLSMIARYQRPMYTYDILTSYEGSESGSTVLDEDFEFVGWPSESGSTGSDEDLKFNDMDYGPPDGTYRNHAYEGGLIQMARPLYGEDVDYQDGTVATLKQEAMDVSVFLEWAANPKQAKAHYYIEKAIVVGSLCVLLSLALLVYVWQKNAKVTIVQKVKSIWRHWINQFKK